MLFTIMYLLSVLIISLISFSFNPNTLSAIFLSKSFGLIYPMSPPIFAFGPLEYFLAASSNVIPKKIVCFTVTASLKLSTVIKPI